jgi:hypothetical protein
MKNKYVQDKKTGKFKGSVGSPVSAPDLDDLAKTRVALDEETKEQDVKTNYGALASVVQKLNVDDPEANERKKNIVTWAQHVPEDEYALNSYFKILSEELDASEEDIRFRFDLLKNAAKADIEISGEPDLEHARFIVPNAKRNLVGTPKDANSCRAIADLETLAAEKRREKRSLVETVEEDGTVWVRYTNNRVSEILRAVNYNEETKELTVQLATKATATDAANTVEYKYQNVHPTIVKQLVSARSMGRFYYYVFANARHNSNMGNVPLKEYSFVAQYSNFMWPTNGQFKGPVPSQKTLDKAKNSLVNE